ncbi:MAG: hypothetical protein JWO19_2082 [Bryobacterales bacterium]|nr:hypothetical protein [Bryobacterales bacterium]
MWHTFRFAPSAALAVLVCLATIFWCFWLLRRSVYDTLDRFLLGFIGLLAIYQGLRLLKEIGLVTLFSSRTLNNVVELTVALLYLLAALIMRLSSHQRRYADFQIRSARAEPRHSIQLSARTNTPARTAAVGDSNSVGIERQLLYIAELVPVLTDSAFKLYIYLSTRIDPATGLALIDEEALGALRRNRAEISLFLKELEKQGLCLLRDEGVTPPITVQVFSPWPGGGPTGSETSTESLIALDGELRASLQVERKARAMSAD